MSGIEAARKLQLQSARNHGVMVELPCLNHQSDLAVEDSLEKTKVITICLYLPLLIVMVLKIVRVLKG
jgi:hypothetical protein